MCILFNIFQRFAVDKELTVAHGIIQGAPLIRGHNQEFRFISIKYNIELKFGLIEGWCR